MDRTLTPKGWPYISPGWSDERVTLIAQPWVPVREKTESPNGAALRNGLVRATPLGFASEYHASALNHN